MTEPRITVVIPTRERCDVLAASLLTVTSQDYDNLQILVSDNNSTDQTADVVAGVEDPRIRYLNTGRRLSMSDNWEYALSHVTDGWVTVIGDDDGLLPGSLQKMADLARATGLDAIRSDVCGYTWPGVLADGLPHLTVPLRSGYQVRSSEAWLTKALTGRAVYPDLPMLYNGGYVRTSVLDELRSRSGRVLKSSSPDVYSAVAIAAVLDNYVYSFEPLAINGRSRHSTGTSNFAADTSDGSPIQRFLAEGNIPFHPDLPLRSDGGLPLSLQVLLYEAYLQCPELHKHRLGITHAQQLAVVFSQRDQHDASVDDWMGAFAAQHGLELGESAVQAAKMRRRRVLPELRSRVARHLEFRVANHADLGDVHAASRAVPGLRAGKAARLRNALPAGRRVAQRLRRGAADQA